ncbi:24275_t:CDS:2 [Gigaspora rosea]|nr:24275_t:CDS:2 [Gigaspora rosea]
MEEEDWLNFGRNIKTELQKHKEKFEFIRDGKELDNDEVIVEKEKIKMAAKQHFQTWTRKNPTNMEHWEEWSRYYETKDIPKGIYKDLMKDIDDEELSWTITESPNQKATGPSNTSNEMLKNLPAGPRKIIVKSKARLAKNVPNSFIQHPGILALRKLEQIQQQQHIRTFTRALTVMTLEKTLLKSRIKQLQQNVVKWILTNTEDCGKVSSKKEGQLIAMHWIRENKNLRRYRGCKKNNKSLKRKRCTIEIKNEDTYTVQVDTKHRIHMRIEDIIENERMFRKNIRSNQTKDIAIPRASLAFTGIEAEKWKKCIDENYMFKHVTIEITAKKKNRRTDNGKQIMAIAKLKHINLKANVEIVSNYKPISQLLNDSITKHMREIRNITNREYAKLKVIGYEEINIITQFDPQYILQNQIVMKLEGYPIIYSTNQTLKHIIQAKNNIEWFNQWRLRALHHSDHSIL